MNTTIRKREGPRVLPCRRPTKAVRGASPRFSVQARLTGSEILAFRAILLRKQAEITEELRGLYDDARYQMHFDNGESPPQVPCDMAESASDAWMRCCALCLLCSEQTILHEIDAALERIENGVYGICEVTGKLISKARLRAIPWTRYCIEYARLREAG